MSIFNRALSSRNFCTLSHSPQPVDSLGIIRRIETHSPITNFEMHPISTPTKLNSHFVALTLLVEVRQCLLRDAVERFFAIARQSSQTLIFDEFDLHVLSMIVNKFLYRRNDSAIV